MFLLSTALIFFKRSWTVGLEPRYCKTQGIRTSVPPGVRRTLPGVDGVGGPRIPGGGGGPPGVPGGGRGPPLIGGGGGGGGPPRAGGRPGGGGGPPPGTKGGATVLGFDCSVIIEIHLHKIRLDDVTLQTSIKSVSGSNSSPKLGLIVSVRSREGEGIGVGSLSFVFLSSLSTWIFATPKFST